MAVPTLYVRIFRDTKGRASLEVIDSQSKQRLRVPERRVGDVIKVVPELEMAGRALASLAPISRSYLYSMPRPSSTNRIYADNFISRLAGGLAEDEHRTLDCETLTPREFEMDTGNAMDWRDLRSCVELGLHQWTRIVHTPRWRCAVCGGRAELLLPNEQDFEVVLRALLTADPWRTTSDRTYERFERLRRRESGDPEFRAVVDPGLLQGMNPPPPGSPEDIVLRLGPKIAGVTLVTPAAESDDFPQWVEVVKAQPHHSEDAHGVKHEHAYVPRADGAHPIELGEVDEVRQLAERLNQGGRGGDLARALLLGEGFGHATITSDLELLRLDEERRTRLVMTPRAAAVLIGIFARRTNHIPVSWFQITAEFHYDDRAFVLAPTIAHFIEDAAAAVENGAVDRRVLRLIWSNVERFGLLARAEDEIAFRTFFGSQGRREILNHFEYLLLLARAVIEGLGELAATVHQVTPSDRPGQPLSWGRLLTALKQASSPVTALISKGAKGLVFSELVSTLRNPLAHSARWQTADSAFGPMVYIDGTDAERVAKSVRQLEGDPMSWGITGERMDTGDLELSIDPYPFAVHLNMYLLSIAEAFLKALSQGAGWKPARRRPPWDMTNPPLDEMAFRVLAAMTWSLPKVNWTNSPN
ncbi:MAG: hypothetical protein M3323_00985 [Actinomycetota bacterium]|nr:hypothetical protein [Actinomycetota bacterium]